MGNISPLPNSSLLHTKSLSIDGKPVSGSPGTLPALTEAEIKQLVKDLDLGSGDKQTLGAVKQGSCDANFCFVDLPEERSVKELVQAVHAAKTPEELEELAYEVQDRAGMGGDLDASDACLVLGEVAMNKQVSPRTVNELAQYAIKGLNQRDPKAAFGVHPAYADLISAVVQSPVQSREANAAIAGLNPERYPPTIAPSLRHPVQQAGESLRQGQLSDLKSTLHQVHASQSAEELSKLAASTLAQLRAGKLDGSDGALILGEILASKAVSPQTIGEIVNYGLQGLQTRDSKSAGGVNTHFVDLLERASQNPQTPKQALAILAALKPDQYPPTVAPYLRGVVSQAAAQLQH
ncbi:MAG: hypothetical protein ACAI44_03180 [Candidatus Sericytochromatia bacterium]